MITQESIQPFLEWIRMHPTSAGLAVFLISLSESLAIVGLLVPGVVMMTAIGSMMGAGILPFYQTLFWAILGAIAGDGISYYLGYHYHEQLRHFWPFRQFPQLLARGEKFFNNHGGKSIVFGRFVGPVRPMIPVIAGMMDMCPQRFLFFNILSAIVWAPLYSLPGILIGLSLGSLSPEVASRAGLLVLLLLLALWCVYELLGLLGSWTIKRLQKTLDWAWQQVFSHFPLILKISKTRQGSAEGQFGLIVLFVLALGSFISISNQVVQETGLVAWNEPVYHFLRALYADSMIPSVLILSTLAAPPVLLSAASVMALWLCYKQRFKAALCWSLSIGLGMLIAAVFKTYTAIPRPDGLLPLDTQYAFPSNHVLCALVVLGFAATTVRMTLPKRFRWMPIITALLLSLLVAFSRLYLSIHWFTDILGSFTLGIAVVSGGTVVFRAIEARPLSLKTLQYGAITLCIVFSIYTLSEYPHLKKQVLRQWHSETFSQKLWWQGRGPLRDLYRSGPIKKQATVFDIQWLAKIQNVEQLLKDLGWSTLPKFNFKTGVMLLAHDPKPDLFPVMPKFHHDRLPVLRMAQILNPHQRLVLQLWQSDYVVAKERELWVGTLRLEEAANPLPLVTLYVENQKTAPNLSTFIRALKGQTDIRLKAHKKVLLVIGP